MSRAERRARGEQSAHEGDDGPVEVPPTLDQWTRITGYNPEKRDYSNPPEDVELPIVLPQVNRLPNLSPRKGVKQYDHGE